MSTAQNGPDFYSEILKEELKGPQIQKFFNVIKKETPELPEFQLITFAN
jgi:hypothetical protein